MQELSPQLEFFSGGYYEPILASIPSKDRVKQIEKLNTFIQKSFNQTPKGLWLTERVWDNSIILDLKACGIEYVIVDDYHFIASGYDRDNLNGYFLTEEGGEKMSLFPISQKLRYAIPFFENSEVNEILHEFKNHNGKNCAIIFDDGEKFGIWPKTYESVYEKEWLRDFFAKTIEDETIEVEFFSDYYSNQKPISLAYLPTVSYFEMVQNSYNFFWELPEVHARLDQKMTNAFNGVYEMHQKHKVHMRLAAYLVAVQRVAEAMRFRGWV